MRLHGVLKSSDEGENWEWVVDMSDFADPSNRDKGWAERDYGVHLGDTFGDEQVSPKGRFCWGIGVGPSNPEVCYTTDFSSIYRTRDGGSFWNQVCTIDHPDGSVSSRGIDVTGPYGLIFDPFDNEHIVLPYTDGGMFHSLNSGRTWIHTIGGVPREWINSCYCMVFDPEVKGKAWSAWAGLHDIPRRKMFAEELFSKYKGGVCNSSDGCTWKLKNNGIVEENPFAWRITILPDGTLFLLVSSSFREEKWVDGSVYKSSDGAESWHQVVLPEGVGGPNDLIYDPSEPECMYLCCWPKVVDGESCYGGLLVTYDSGHSWTWAFDAGVFRSDDRGKNWRRLKGCNFQWYYRPIPDPVHKGMLYLTTFGSSVWYGPASGVEEASEDGVTRW